MGEQNKYILAINSVEETLQIALGLIESTTEVSLVCSHNWQKASQGTELLMDIVSYVLGKYNIHPKQISKYACTVGPGSFTGIRLAIMTGAGLARSVNLEQAGFTLNSALAYNAAFALRAFNLKTSDSILWSVTYARRGLVYAQPWKTKECKGNLERTIESGFIEPCDKLDVYALNELLDIISNSSRPIIFGSGLSKNKSAFIEKFGNSSAILCPESMDTLEANLFLKLAYGSSFSKNDLEPLYIRGSDAEDNFKHIAESLNLEHNQAKKRLDELLSSKDIS